ncbi:hypothetical protein L1987_31255 [Smallanthus sonchifolius]|uniref:Uncharacterized protein n=1 Tax=Smallanthus sonchifolius TaxID=185202 RepID=A0ACB9I5S4_9ASTR|nr:hypothetical protein L1987_31255 [Smallanthus sonchifolius]
MLLELLRQVDELSVLLSKGRGLFPNMGKRTREGAKQKDAEGSGGSAGKGSHHYRRMRPDWQEGIHAHFDGSMCFTADDLLNATTGMTAKDTYGSD